MQRNFLNKLSDGVAKLYSARLMQILLITAVVFFWLFNFSHFSFSNPSLIKISGGPGLLDVMPFYTAQEAYSMLGQYGMKGRELYLKFLAADFMFIPVYSFGFSFLFTRSVKAKFGENDHWLWLNLLPFAIGTFDCLENFSILSMLLMYPESNWALATFSGFATLCKTVLTLVSLLCLGYLGVSLIIRRIVNQPAKKALTIISKNKGVSDE